MSTVRGKKKLPLTCVCDGVIHTHNPPALFNGSNRHKTITHLLRRCVLPAPTPAYPALFCDPAARHDSRQKAREFSLQKKGDWNISHGPSSFI